MKTHLFSVGVIGALFFLTFCVDSRGSQDLSPNEMGQVMILMYHQIRSPEKDYVRSAENFRKDLQTLYDRGYRLAHLNDLIDAKVSTPRGKTPVVLTFDDAGFGQIDKTQKSGEPAGVTEWAPDSAVRIILDFAKEHPDMGIAGTFYINPFHIQMPSAKSSQWREWMQEMVDLGFEFGNHTMTHPNLKKSCPEYALVQKEIGSLQAWVHQYLPDYRIRSMALPFGVYPLETEWAVHGSYEGETYDHEALMKVGANPSVSPFDESWQPLHLPRIRAQDLTGNLPVSGFWIDYFDRHPEKRFVSDGDPSKMTLNLSDQKRIRQNLLGKFKVVVRRQK